MNTEERIIVIRCIASILDHPSVYMGGPSKGSLRKAEKIVENLEYSQRLKSTTCDHSDYKDYHTNGIYCPRCSMKIKEEHKS